VTGVGILLTFGLEAWGWQRIGCLLRAATATGYLLVEVRWGRRPGAAPRGTLAAGLPWLLGIGCGGMALAGLFPTRRVAVEHLLFICGFGGLILLVASRVLFGHSGDPEGFSRRSWAARALLGLVILAAATRASAEFFPRILVSHHIYAALTWVAVAILWIVWHRRRFLRSDE
jgi:uncharacterized protein involved in response to NO